MPFTVYADNADFDTEHERRAVTRLIRSLDARFGKSAVPYALLVNIVIDSARIDLIALTPQAIIVIDLKEVGSPDTVIDGAENGSWYAHPPNAIPFELNKGRPNPFKQLDSYRFTLMDWFARNAKLIFDAQRIGQLNFRHINARVVFSPSINSAVTRKGMSFLSSKIGKWFDVIGLDALADNLHDAATEGITLSQEEMEKIVSVFRLPRYDKDQLPMEASAAIPERIVFSRPPVPRTPIGRESEFDQLMKAIESANDTLLVIGGPGGVGKTHLASRLARELAEDRKVYWVYCTDHADLTLDTLLLAFARELPDTTLGHIVARSSERLDDRLDIILDYLENMRVCLFLDDYHVLDAHNGLQQLFRRIDRAGQETKVILTVRHRPEFWSDPFETVDSTWELRLEGLPCNQVEKYLRSRPGLSEIRLTSAESENIWAKTGGGNPGVLRLLARWSMDTSPVDFVRDMNVYDDASAQRWYSSLLERLSKPAYQLARKLSVLRGVFPDTLATALHGDSDTSGILAELLDHYVIGRADFPRSFVMIGLLQDFIYDYQIGPDQRANLHRQTAKHLFALTMEPPIGYSSLSLQAEGLHHAHAAQDWRALLRQSRPVVQQLSKAGEWQRGRYIAERALQAAEATKDRSEEAYWLLELTHQLRRLDKIDQANALCQRGYDLVEALGSTELRANAHYQHGVLAHRAGNLSDARRWHESALALNRTLGDQVHMADSLGRLGTISRDEGDAAAALVTYQESVRIYEQISDVHGLGIAYIQLGTLAKNEEDFERANNYFRRSLDAAIQGNNVIGQSISLQSMAEVASQQGNFVRAVELADEALAAYGTIKSGRSYRITLGIKVDVLLDANRIEEAKQILPEVEALCSQQNDALGQIFNHKRRARIALQIGDKATGIAMLHEASQQLKSKNHIQYAKVCDRLIAAAE